MVGVVAVMSCILFLPAAQAQVTPTVLASWGFDNVTAPALPDGWATAGTNGGAWATASTSVNPAGIDAVSAPNMLVFNAHAASPSNLANGYLTLSEDVTHYVNARVRFWMYHDSGASGRDDYIQFIYSTNAWSTLFAVVDFHRYSSSPGWQEHEVFLPAAQTDHQATLSIGFTGHGAGGNDIFIDDVRLIAELDPYCDPPEGTAGTQVQVISTGFGAKKGKVYLVGQKTPLKVTSWLDGNATCEVTGIYPPGVYDVSVQPADPKGAAPIILANAFTVRAPVIAFVDAGGAPGDVLDLDGRFLTTKKGKILLRNSGPTGVIEKSCKVVSWTMDTTTTGNGSVHFVVPKVPSGTYDLTLQVKGMPDAFAPNAVTVP